MKKKVENIWDVISPKVKITNPGDVTTNLLKNRGLTTKQLKDEFFHPRAPKDISTSDVGLKTKDIEKGIRRIIESREKHQKVIVYGDYDADGICATAIMWECLYENGIDAIPYIPDRFSDGYGLNEKSIQRIKEKHKDLSLIITVDNGIVANSAVEAAQEMGIDTIITDHHEPGEKYPKAFCVVHSQEIGGAGVAWFFAREVRKALQSTHVANHEGLELAAIGTIADQIPLLSANRSLVTFGLEELKNTKRVGLKSLLTRSGVDSESIDTNTVGFVIAPRLNAMGRLEHAIESLRLLCTKSVNKANELANHLEKTNKKRQEVVEEVIAHARESALNGTDSVIVLAHESYHQGVVGLAASKLVDEYHRPAIVFSILGKESKASARSIEGFNIIEAIREHKSMLLAAGGHPMAAGVKIKTNKIEAFRKKLNLSSQALLTPQMLTPRLTIEFELPFKVLHWDLLESLHDFAPFGSGNKTPLFLTKSVSAWDIRAIGTEGRHLKFKVTKDSKTLDAIGFGMGNLSQSMTEECTADIVYYFEENEYRGVKSMQLRIRDMKFD